MALFGTSPVSSNISGPLGRSRNSLFDDDSVPRSRSDSLFNDDTVGQSPWGSAVSKKGANAVKSLLPSSNVPEVYVDIYDNVLKSGYQVGSGVSLTGIKGVLANAAISAQDQTRILDIILPNGQAPVNGVSRDEFNVFLALIGLAQEGEEVSLDSVDDRRRSLPEPNLSKHTNATPSKVSDTIEGPVKKDSDGIAGNAKPSRDATMAQSEPDSWGSPASRQGHKHTENTSANHSIRDKRLSTPLDQSIERSTSAFTTTASEQPSDSTAQTTNEQPPVSASNGGWGSFGADGTGAFQSPQDNRLGGDEFGDDGREPGQRPTSRSIGGTRAAPASVEETVSIVVLPEKEGMFLFQHRNYEVTSIRRGSKVVRRYSDFVWLLDCLHKRYPFRQLPLLPPKRVAVNGNHLSSDAAFVEKRRRGLTRFTNALIRHPVLSQEQLVTMFLTVPTELAVWRKQATISVQEEFTGKTLPPTLEDSLPSTLDETFETVRTGVRRAADIYINLCNLLERLTKRNEGIAGDFLRFSLALQSLTETTESSYHVDTNDVPLLNEGLNSTAKQFSACQTILEDEARASDLGVLEDMKRQRDVLVAVRDMFDRRDRYAKDNIPTLERRIETNESKLAGLREKPEGTVKPAEIEKVENAIHTDKESIVAQHARGVFIKECLKDELEFFQQSQYHVSRLIQDWSQERVKYAELQADSWRLLSEQVESMPLSQ